MAVVVIVVCVCVSHLLWGAVKKPLELLFPAPLVSRIKNVDLGLSPGCRTYFCQLATDGVVALLQVLHGAFLRDESQQR